MFGLEEETIIPVEDTRELDQRIYLEADCSMDIYGEYEFLGSYKVRISPNQIGNFYAYHGSLSRGYKKRTGRWRVYLNVCGGASNQITSNILSKTAPSKKQARKMMVQAILDFEKTSRFKEELAPKIYHEDNRVPILKEVDGELLWIASTWDDPYAVIKKTSYSSYTAPIGYGTFYYRKRKWDYEYPRKEDGRKDYDAEPERLYHEPTYGNIEVSYWSVSSSGKKASEMKEKINQAIFNLDDQQELKRQYIRYLDLKRI